MIDNTNLQNTYEELAKQAAQENRVLWSSQTIEGDQKVTRFMSTSPESAGVLLNHAARMIYGSFEHLKMVEELLEALKEHYALLNPAAMKAIQKMVYLAEAMGEYESKNVDLTREILGICQDERSNEQA